MISSQLFRPNDVVHFREDLAPNRTYKMLHKPSDDCTTAPGSGSWCRLNSGDQAVIADHSATGKYIVSDIAGLCDEMFQEAVRIAPYLDNVEVPPISLLVDNMSPSDNYWNWVMEDWTGQGVSLTDAVHSAGL